MPGLEKLNIEPKNPDAMCVDQRSAEFTAPLKPTSLRLYHDETLTSFFRRPCFTPDGSMLITPSGYVKIQNEEILHEESEYNPYYVSVVFARNEFSK